MICDIVWAKRIIQTTRQEFNELFDSRPKAAVGIIKDGRHGSDLLYVRAHPESSFWAVLMASPDPPPFLPFVKDEVLHPQYAHIRKY